MAAMNILGGVRILDMTTVMFGPYCTEILASLGADVIKFEPETGDELRRVGKPRKSRRMGPVHLTMNRGKRSVSWDLKSPQGRKDMAALVQSSDVLIHNLRHDALERVGLDYASVRSLREDIIWVHCSGFGTEGVYAGRPAYDDIIQALSGAASLIPRVLGGPDPKFLPLAIADKVSGLHAVYAVLAALFHRERTGEGQNVEVPMLESVTHFLLQEHLHDRVFVPPDKRAGYPRQLDPLRQPMATRDGFIVVAPYTDQRWLRFFDAVGRSDIYAREELATPILRLKNVSIMQEEMAAIIFTQTSAHWLKLLTEQDIPAAPVNSLDDLFDDPHLASVGFFERLTHPSEGPYIGLRPPVRFGGADPAETLPAPLIGEHTQAVLDELRSASSD